MTNIQRAGRRIDQQDGVPLGARNANLHDLSLILKDQHARKVDLVTPATKLRSQNGTWVVEGAEPVIDGDGVALADGRYRPTAIADGQAADRLGIPTKYLRRLREKRPDLYDANVNGWLHGSEALMLLGNDYPITDGDPRSFMLRGFRTDTDDGIARALLSDRYKIVDHLDVVTAALDGVREADADVQIRRCDLTESRMYVTVAAPAVRELAPDLLRDYRSPFSGLAGADNPVVFAGFRLTNSETGGGAYTLTPYVEFEVCSNGMTITRDAIRGVHIGGKLEDGIIDWSDETQQRNLELVRLKTRDAVKSFLDVEYLRRTLDGIRTDYGKPVEKPAETVKQVVSTLKLGDVADDVLAHFIAGGSLTAGGIMQAVTSWAQTVDDPDQAADAEAVALDALALAAA